MNKLLVTLLQEKTGEGVEMMSYFDLEELLKQSHPKEACQYARALLRDFGCIPTSLALSPENFYKHRPEDFTEMQQLGLAEAFDRFDLASNGLVDEHEIVQISQHLNLGFDLVKCKLLLKTVDLKAADHDHKGQLDFNEFLACIKLNAIQEHVANGLDMELFSFRKYALRQFPHIKDGSEDKAALKKRILLKLSVTNSLQVTNRGSVLNSNDLPRNTGALISETVLPDISETEYESS
jgi:hypothetical protein